MFYSWQENSACQEMIVQYLRWCAIRNLRQMGPGFRGYGDEERTLFSFWVYDVTARNLIEN